MPKLPIRFVPPISTITPHLRLPKRNDDVGVSGYSFLQPSNPQTSAAHGRQLESSTSGMSFSRILIVDDSSAWQRFLQWQLSLEPNLEIVGTAGDGLEAVSKAEQLQPDLVLLDVHLPQLDGIEAARRISEIAPATKILFLSDGSHPDIVRAALEAGGRAYILKLDVVADLFEAIEAVAQGKLFLSRNLPDVGR